MTSRRILANTAFNTAGRVWMLLVNLLLTPLILSYLGDKRFALWALFWTLQTWVAFTDLGIGVSVVRIVAGLASKMHRTKLNSTLCSALAFNFSVAFLVLLLSWLLAGEFVTRLHVGVQLQGDALMIALLGPVVLVLLALITVLDCFLRGFQRYDLINLVAVAVSVINAVGVWIALYFGYGITGLLVATIVVYLAQVSALAVLAKRVFPGMRLHLRYISLRRLLRMMPFGLHLQAGRLAELASYQADKIILAIFTPLYFVTTYDLGSKVATILRQIPYLLTSAIFPVISQLHSDRDFDRLWTIYSRGSKYLWMVSTPLFFGLSLTAPLVIQAWLGYVAPDVHRAVLLLGFGFWCSVNLSVAYNVGTGMGWSKPVMHLSLVQAAANLVLSWWLVSVAGYPGVLYATASTLMVTSALFYWRFCKEFGRDLFVDLRLFLRVLTANAVPAAALLLWLDGTGIDGGYASRWAVLPPLSACVVIYVVLYLVAIRLLKLLDGADRAWLGRFCPPGISRLLFVG